MTTDVITVSLSTGQTSKAVPQRINNGRVIGVSMYHNHDFNDGRNILVRAALKDVSGNEVFKMQDIRNLRNRETAYNMGFMPVNLEGGRTYELSVAATEALAADTTLDLIFHYEIL